MRYARVSTRIRGEKKNRERSFGNLKIPPILQEFYKFISIPFNHAQIYFILTLANELRERNNSLSLEKISNLLYYLLEIYEKKIVAITL